MQSEEFSNQVQRCYSHLWSVAAGLNGRCHADDVVQDALTQAFQKRPMFQPGSNFAAWVSQFVRFISSNMARKAKRRNTASVSNEVLESVRCGLNPTKGPVSENGCLHSDQQDFDDRVVFALETLPPVTRTCFLLSSVQGLTYLEVSGLMDLQEGTVASHVSRARSELRRILSHSWSRA